MREQLRPYQGVHKLNYLCILALEMLGEASLTRIPALGAGFKSVLHTLHPDIVVALRNLRLTGVYPGTNRGLRLMVDAYKSHFDRATLRKNLASHEADPMPQRFVINDDLSIARTWTHLVPPDVEEAMLSMTGILALHARPPKLLHHPGRRADISNSGDGYNGIIEPLGFTPPPPPMYDLQKIGSAPGMVLWSDLVATANRFDSVDAASGRQLEGDRKWFSRLHDEQGLPKALLMQRGQDGLTQAEGIDLVGIKHLVGLPGAGKTTMLFLLAGHFIESGISACFLFPSIEVASGFIETLGAYNVEVGLLSGQGETSKSKHAMNFAMSVAGQNKGFGVTRKVAPFFATNCALGGFASDEQEDFPHSAPPCQSILQKPSDDKRSKTFRCALSSVCGYQHGERSLATTNLWAGHIMSTDRRVSPLFVDADIRHFEFIAKTFDVLIIDECDGAQSALDTKGTPAMKLIGDAESLWSTLIRDLHDPAARGHNAFFSGLTIPSLLEMTGRFGRAAERLGLRVAHLPSAFRAANANSLLTSLTIISDMYPIEPDGSERSILQTNHRKAIESIWDTAVKAIAFRGDYISEDDEEHEGDPAESATLDKTIHDATELSGCDEEALRTFYESLHTALEKWDRDGSEKSIHQVASVLRAAPMISSDLDNETFFAQTALLISVSMLVLQHFGLAPHLRLLNSMNLVSDNVFESRCSRDQLAVLPESLAGRMSGVRYTVSDSGDVDISHISFTGTPRALPRRMIDIGLERTGGGMAVLMTSATSMLEQSPNFHVNIGPDYVLRRPNAGDGWAGSRYKFTPKNDPLNNSEPLRFSGAKLDQRERILKSMADQLLRGGQLSDVESAMRDNDIVDGVGRRAAFVVNSYDQCELLFNHIQANHSAWRGRVRYLTRPTHHGRIDPSAVTAADVEGLGDDPRWNLLIFPMNAIGRGVNIVYRFGKRIDKAMIGSLFFLTRPHPRGDSLQLIQGLVGRASEQFDQQKFGSMEEALAALKIARNETSTMVEYLLGMPLMAQSLGDFAEPFVADQMIIILQTIGRAMRGDCPAFVHFVDAAWAPNSANGLVDTERTSMLAMMQSILRKCLEHPDSATRECYSDIYKSFAAPMNLIENLKTRSRA